MMKSVQNRYKPSVLSVVMCLSLVASSVAVAGDDASENFWQRNEQALIGGSIGVAAALIGYIICSVKNANERSARKEQRHHLEGLITELRAWVQRLQLLYEALPFETFQKEADQKIGQVRELLTQDLTKHRDTLSYDVQRVAAEISKLREERDKMISELDKQRAFLQQVEQFVRSVKDQQGEAFLNNVVAAKQDVEQMIGQLRTQRAELANQLADIARAANEHSGTLATHERALSNFQGDINNIDTAIVQRQAQLDKAQRVTQDMDREVDRVSNALSAAQKQHRLLKSEFDQALGQLSQYISSARSEKSGLEQQVEQARYSLQDVATQITSLMDSARAINHELTVHTSSEVVAGPTKLQYHAAPRQPAMRSGSSATPAPKAGESEEALVATAKKQLANAIGAFNDAASCRKAYLKFTRKNHPDKGGDKAAFQAVSGVYNLLVDHKLLERAVIYLPGKISVQIQVCLADLKKQANKIK